MCIVMCNYETKIESRDSVEDALRGDNWFWALFNIHLDVWRWLYIIFYTILLLFFWMDISPYPRRVYSHIIFSIFLFFFLLRLIIFSPQIITALKLKYKKKKKKKHIFFFTLVFYMSTTRPVISLYLVHKTQSQKQKTK